MTKNSTAVLFGSSEIGRLPPAIGPYLARLAAVSAATLDLAALYATGSIALGDFQPPTSDIDILAVTSGPTPHDTLRRLADTISALPVPARGLECVVYPIDALGHPTAAPRWNLNLNAGPRLAAPHVGLDASAEPTFWFVLDLALARGSAIPLVGPPAAQIIGELPAGWIAAALREGIRWHAIHEPGSANRVLGLCRAWRWATDGTLVSKSSAAEWAFRRSRDRLIPEALRIRVTGEGSIDPADMLEFVRFHGPQVERLLDAFCV